jgi:hypothetical protein
VGTRTQGLYGGFDARMGGHQDEQRLWAEAPYLPQQGDAVHAGHSEVADDELEFARFKDLERFFGGLGGADVVALVAQYVDQAVSARGVIVDD